MIKLNGTPATPEQIAALAAELGVQAAEQQASAALLAAEQAAQAAAAAVPMADLASTIAALFEPSSSASVELVGGKIRINATTQPAGTAPSITGTPAITGTPREGQTITFTSAAASGSPSPTVTYALLLDDVLALSSIVSGTTIYPAGSAGKIPKVREVASNGVAPDAVATSVAGAAVAAPFVAPSITSVPVIIGTPTAGQPLAWTNATATGNPAPTLTHYVSLDGVTDPTPATSGAYTLPENADNKQVDVTALASNGIGSPATATSVPQTVQPAPVPVTTTFTDAQMASGFWGTFNEGSAGGLRRSWGITVGTWTGWVRGSSASIRGVGGTATPIFVSVDGGAETSPALLSGTQSNGFWPLYSGLSDDWHFVTVRGTLGGTWSTFRTGSANLVVLSVTGLTPQIAFDRVASSPNLAVAKYVVGNPATIQHSYTEVAATSVVSGTTTPTAVPYTSTFDGNLISYMCGGAVRFRARCSELWIYGRGDVGHIQVDGGARSRYQLVSPRPASEYAWRKLTDGLDGTAFHDYVIAADTTTNGHIQGQIWAVAPSGTGAAFNALPATLPRVLQIGDSMTFARGQQPFNVGGAIGAAPYQDHATVDTYWWASKRGYIGRAAGRAGETSTGLLGGTTPRLTQVLDALGGSWDAFVLAIGRNDAATASATRQSNYVSLINILQARNPAAKIIVRGVDFGTAWGNGSAAAVDADLLAAVNTVNSPNVRFVPTTAWTGTTSNSNDNTHPNLIGYDNTITYAAADYAPFL